MKMTIETAKHAMNEAKLAYEEQRDSGVYDNELLQATYSAYHYAELRYHVTVVNDANYGIQNPISREDLLEELNEAIDSKIDFAPVLLQHFEEAQVRSGLFDRWDVYAKASDGSIRYMSDKAFDRALDVLEKHCRMRPDSGALCPPYRLKVGDNDVICAE